MRRLIAFLDRHASAAVVAASLLFAAGIGALAQSGFTASQLQQGTALQPVIASTVDSTTGQYFPAAGQQCATVSGTQIGCWTSTGLNFAGNNSPFRISSINIGSVAYGSLGTSTTPVAGTIYWAEIWIPVNKTLTGCAWLNAATVGTDKGLCALYNSAGTLVANSALAGATTSGANAFQEAAFTATYAAKGPGRFWLAYQTNGTTDRFRTVAASTFFLRTTSTTGAFGTLTALTPPTTFTADVGPIGYVY